jgi:hypothetical protein
MKKIRDDVKDQKTSENELNEVRSRVAMKVVKDVLELGENEVIQLI